MAALRKRSSYFEHFIFFPNSLLFPAYFKEKFFLHSAYEHSSGDFVIATSCTLNSLLFKRSCLKLGLRSEAFRFLTPIILFFPNSNFAFVSDI